MASEPSKHEASHTTANHQTVAGAGKGGGIELPDRPNIAAFAVFAVSVAVSVFILVFQDLRNNPLAQVFAGVMMALAVSVILFSVVPSKAPVRAAIGLGGAALFYFLLWPEIEKAIHPPPSTTTVRGSLYYVTAGNDIGLRPVQGAEVRVANTSLKSQQKTGETGDFTIMDAPSDIKELEAFYGGQVYVIQLSKFPATNRYPVIPPNTGGSSNGNDAKLSEGYLVDATLVIRGAYWERKTVSLNDIGVSAPAGNENNRVRACAQPEGEFVVDALREDFHGGIRYSAIAGAGYHDVTMSDGCISVYVDGSQGNAFGTVSGITVALKRLQQNGQCGMSQIEGAKLSYSGVTQIPLNVSSALGPCVGPDLPGQPKWTTTVVFKKPDGSVADTVHLQGFEQAHVLNGTADVWMNSTGLLTVALKHS